MKQADSREPDLNGKVAGEIRAELGRKGLRQWELAVQLDWNQSMLSRRLSGLIPFSTDEIERIARALDVPPEQLMSPRAPIELPADWQDQLEAELSAMADKTRQINQLARRRPAS